MQHNFSFWQKLKHYFEFWIIDHEFVRAIYRNFHRISDNAFRSAHPSYGFIKNLKEKHGLKTIINLRGANQTGQYLIEKQACEKLGIKLMTAPFSSRRAPTPERIKTFFNALDTAEYPILLHCKSGADRAGLASALYQFYKNGVPLDESHQLRASYGHFKSSETGVLDYFIEQWNEFHQQNPEVAFTAWLETAYDADKINQQFQASKFGNLLVNKILRRE